MHGVVETPSYLSDAERLFTGEERIAIVDRIAANPQCGVLIPDTGRIRKVPLCLRRTRQARWRASDLFPRSGRCTYFPARSLRQERKGGLDAGGTSGARKI